MNTITSLGFAASTNEGEILKYEVWHSIRVDENLITGVWDV